MAVTQTAIELMSAPRILTPDVLSEPLFSGPFLHARGPTTFVVESMTTNSPLVAAGVLPGDRLRYDRPLGRWYNLVAGDKVTLAVLHDDTSRASLSNGPRTSPRATRC